jgi:hypothetical protein
MVIKYAKILHRKTLQSLPQIGIFGLKTNHLATLAHILLCPAMRRCAEMRFPGK